MKPKFDYRRLLILIAVLFSVLTNSSCMSTEIIANNHSENLDNEPCQTLSHWKYLWGFVGSDELFVGPNSTDTECACPNEAMASVEVKQSFGDFVLSLITIGIVNHRKVIYKCTESDDGEQPRNN